MLVELALYPIALFAIGLLFACALVYGFHARTPIARLVADAPALAPVDALELQCVHCSSLTLVAGFRSDQVVRAKTRCAPCRSLPVVPRSARGEHHAQLA